MAPTWFPPRVSSRGFRGERRLARRDAHLVGNTVSVPDATKTPAAAWTGRALDSVGCGDRIRTDDHRVMRAVSRHVVPDTCAESRGSELRGVAALCAKVRRLAHQECIGLGLMHDARTTWELTGHSPRVRSDRSSAW